MRPLHVIDPWRCTLTELSALHSDGFDVREALAARVRVFLYSLHNSGALSSALAYSIWRQVKSASAAVS